MNLIEGLQEELNRCRELLQTYREIPTGGFGAAVVEQSIREGEAAIASRDVVRMLRAYKDLQARK